jgi:hypothetical protein
MMFRRVLLSLLAAAALGGTAAAQVQQWADAPPRVRLIQNSVTPFNQIRGPWQEPRAQLLNVRLVDEGGRQVYVVTYIDPDGQRRTVRVSASR